jgi:DNA-directed RNA polymerase II subunit RPB2
MGLQSDQDIIREIFPDPESVEAKMLEPLLLESIVDACPFFDQYTAVQYIKTFTKGFSESHVLDILYNQTFIHVENRPQARVTFLAECVRKILFVIAGLNPPTDRDDIRNQRCITSGVLTRMLFQGAYSTWKKGMLLTLDKEYKYNSSIYQGPEFAKLFQQGTLLNMFRSGMITESIMRGFKGKWGTGMGEEKTGVIQPLSRLSYMDFLSHCRRVVLNFDTGMKMAGPRRLHPSQYGYFCTNETPAGGSIGITKNLSIMTSISIATEPTRFIEWLFQKKFVTECSQMTPMMSHVSVPVYVNDGIIGYTLSPVALCKMLKYMKWTGCLPSTSSIIFSILQKRVYVYLDEGRPVRPLIHLEGGVVPYAKIKAARSWRELVLGNFPRTSEVELYNSNFFDPLPDDNNATLEDYMKLLYPHIGCIEYVDPYESNETFIAMFPEYIKPETSHLEIHPSTMLGLLTSVIPFPNHNQSPRNQLSCSQSKQGLSVYATNYRNRFDNMVHVLSYGEAPIVRTLYYDYIADGEMPYGQNLMVAIGSFTGYNQDDGIIFNADSFARGMFRNMTFRSYEIYEEDDEQLKTRTRIGNPARIPGWTSLRAGVDYSKLDERGIIRVGEFVDENTILVGCYMQTPSGEMSDASLTAQVWTRGRVEKVVVMTNNSGRALVKIRVTQDRIPELGDKFSTRHGQKGTIGMLIRAHDMPRTAGGMVPDMIVNPHCMPSRMTMAQLLESLLGKAAPGLGAIGNATAFMNEGNPTEQIGKVLQDQFNMNPYGEDILYDGMSGAMIPSTIFMGNIYIMRLKHMPEDKWNARGEGRREQKTHQPTGGRGNQGGLRIGEMERDAILGHGIADFIRESYTKRSDGYSTYVCNGCGTIPIFNQRKNLYVCPLCDGPLKFTEQSMHIVPPNKRSLVSFSKIEMPYSMKLWDQEMAFFLNMGMRLLTDRDVKKLRGAPIVNLTEDQTTAALEAELPERLLEETAEVERIEPTEEAPAVNNAALGVVQEDEEEAAPVNAKVLNAAVEAAVNATLKATTTSGRVTAAAVNAAVNAAVAAARQVPEEVATGPTGAPANTFQMTPAANSFQMSPAANSLQMTPAADGSATFSAPVGLGEEDFSSLDDSAAPVASPPAQQQGGGGSSSVNVQTSSQPVLVIPMNVGPPPAATQMIGPPVNGAPSTISVDTSRNAIQNTIEQTSQRPKSRRGSGASNSSAPAANAIVNVIKQG